MKKPTDLIGGPYRQPKYRIGDFLRCERWGEDVEIVGVSDGRISWPVCMPKRCGKRSLVLTGDLVRAIETESAAAIMHHFGIGESTVILFRKILGVTDASCEGTRLARGLRAGTYSTAGRAGRPRRRK